MIEDADSKLDYYSHWGYELTEKVFYWLDKLMYKNELLLV